MLELQGVETFYGRSQVLFGVDLSVPAGEMVTLLGRNGMGKTTTVRSIMGLTPARSGSIQFGGVAITQLPPYRVAQLGIGLAPENRQVFPTLTVRENLVATAAGRSRGTRAAAWDVQRVLELFPILRERINHLGSQLSGGEQQMVAIGRALMGKPDLLLLDEPSMGLAPAIVDLVFQSIVELHKQGQSILLVEQNAAIALSVCDYGYVMKRGQIVVEGTADALKESPEVLEAYLS